MWSYITAVVLFVYHSVCEYILFLVIDLLFRGPLDKATTDRDLGVLWAIEGSVLLVATLIVGIISHRPLVIGVMTSLTFLYSLHKWDDSVKELIQLTVHLLRWGDSRFFHLRCFLRRQWRRWKSKEGVTAHNFESTPVNRVRGWPWSGTYPLAAQRTPRMGPAQLFSSSGLANTDPPLRRWTGPATRFVGSPVGPLKIDDESENWRWKFAVVSAVKAGGHAVTVVVTRATHHLKEWFLQPTSHHSPVVRPPRGMKTNSTMPGLNPLLQAIAHCPALMKALNGMRPSYSCSIDQEALITSLLPILNRLSPPDVEVEAENEERGPVDAREVHENLQRVIGCQSSLSEIVESLLLQLHSTCKEIDRLPRLRDGMTIPREIQTSLQDETICRELLDSNYRELLQLISPSSLLSISTAHSRSINRISDLAFLASKWRAGNSKLRQLLETQSLDLTLCPSCSRPGVCATTHLLIRATGIGEEGFSRLSIAWPGLCEDLHCVCGGIRDPGALSPIALTTPRPPGTPGARPTAQTSTPVPTKRCRNDGGCCRRILKHLPPLLFVHVPSNGKEELFVTPEVEIGVDSRMQGDLGCTYSLRAIVSGGAAYCRVGKRWFHCEDEEVKEWRWSAIRGCERIMLLEKKI